MMMFLLFIHIHGDICTEHHFIFVTDLENNHSQLVAQRKPVRKQQIRRLRRRRCRQRGRLWKRGKCLKMGKRQQKKPYIDLHGNTLDYSNKFPTRSYSK